MKTNSTGKSFTILIFHDILIFLSSLHKETVVKYVFHEMLQKKYFTVYP